MLLVNAQQQVVGWFARVKDMDKKEGDTVYKTKKDAVAGGFGTQWDELRPKKERTGGGKRSSIKTGAYKVVAPEKLKDTKDDSRTAALEVLKSCSTVEAFLEKCPGYKTEKTEVTAQSIFSYALRRGIIEMA